MLVHPRKSANGLVHRITPKSAGWTYVGFEARDLKKGARVSLKSGAMETCVVLLSGKARIESKGFDSGPIGERGEKVSQTIEHLHEMAELGIQVAHGTVIGAGSLYPLELMAEQVIPAVSKF